MSESNGPAVLLPSGRKNKSVTLRQANELSPPPAEGVGAFAEAALSAAFNGITDGDMKEMMAKIMEQAKGGDMKAAKFVLEFLGAHKAPPPQVTFHMHKTKRTSSSRQTQEVRPRPGTAGGDDPGGGPVPAPPTRVPDPPHVTVLRRFAAKIIRADGPSPGPGLAGQLGVDGDELHHLMLHEWFQQENGGWALTVAGRREGG